MNEEPAKEGHRKGLLCESRAKDPMQTVSYSYQITLPQPLTLGTTMERHGSEVLRFLMPMES